MCYYYSEHITAVCKFIRNFKFIMINQISMYTHQWKNIQSDGFRYRIICNYFIWTQIINWFTFYTFDAASQLSCYTQNLLGYKDI